MTQSPAAPSHLDGDFGWALGLVFRAYVKAAGGVTEDLPGAHRGYQVLAATSRDAPTSQSALAHRLGIDRTVMTYLLDDLEAAGLVARQATPTDRRTRLVVSTDAGRTVLEHLETRLAEAESQVLAGLPAGDQLAFKGLLRRVACRANELDPVADPCHVVADRSSDVS